MSYQGEGKQAARRTNAVEAELRSDPDTGLNQNPFARAAILNPFAPSALDAPAGNPFDAARNPFAAARTRSSATGDSFRYSLIQSGPEVESGEVEIAHLASIEVVTSWDANVLHVEHLTPPRSYFVGEEIGDREATCDFYVPAELLGASRAPLVLANGGRASLVLVPSAKGTVDIPGEGVRTLTELIASGRARASSSLAGAHELDLPPGARARLELEHSGLVFEINAVNAGKPLTTSWFAQLDTAAYVYFALSVVLHVGIVASLAFFMPRMSGDDSEAIDRESLLMMQHLLTASAEREDEKRDNEAVHENSAPGGATAAAAKDPSGTAGNPISRETNHRLAVKGPSDSVDLHLAREAAKAEASTWGIIGLLSTATGDPSAPTSPWGRDESLGADVSSARGSMWGDSIGDAAGSGGLGLSGTGEGGGGNGDGIGIRGIGTLGNGLGGTGGGGYGRGHGMLPGTHIARSPVVTPGTTEVNGRIPREVIQRVVRQNFGRFRLCYENGLRTNPALAGRVLVKFIIDRTGAVGVSQDGGSELADPSVVSCVVRRFGDLSFPAPEGGVVTVQYPITFSPGGE